jgi:hypothetical protein
VRRYQNWLQEVVARVGFEPLGAQAVMVKRLAVRLSEPVLKPLPVVDGQVPTPITSAQYNASRDGRARAAPLSHSQPVRGYWWQTHAKTNNR